MTKTYIGIDNGVTGTIGIIRENGGSSFIKTPIIKQLNYTKKKAYISRIDYDKFYNIISNEVFICGKENIIIGLERPMVNPGRFKATISAIRSLESMTIAIEKIGIPFLFIDSKEWQKELLPSGIKGAELKKISIDIGARLFPIYKDFKHPDRDGILIAEYLRRINR